MLGASLGILLRCGKNASKTHWLETNTNLLVDRGG